MEVGLRMSPGRAPVGRRGRAVSCLPRRSAGGRSGPPRGKDRVWRGPLSKAAKRRSRVVECGLVSGEHRGYFAKVATRAWFPPVDRVVGPRGGPRLRELGRTGKISFSVFELIRKPLIFM